VPSSASHPALLVAEQAVGSEQGGRYVLVVNDKNAVESRPVEVGRVHDGGLREVMRTRQVLDTDAQGRQVVRRVEVLGPADRVVVRGLQRVRPGTAVEPHLVNMLTLLPEGDGHTQSSSSDKPE
jgi:multidrug efflux system membrane fusion protein